MCKWGLVECCSGCIAVDDNGSMFKSIVLMELSDLAFAMQAGMLDGHLKCHQKPRESEDPRICLLHGRRSWSRQGQRVAQNKMGNHALSGGTQDGCD